MGILRFLLAISVVFTHLGPTFGYFPMPGTFAVYAFYIISGFYMSLILNEKYVGKNSIKIFLSNRILRIYPIYLIVLALTVIIFFFIKDSINNPLTPFFYKYSFFHGFELLKVFLFDIIRNVFLITNSVYIFPNKIYADLLVVSLSWTLGLEMLFYFVSPFIVRRSIRQIIIIVFVCFLIRTLDNFLFVTQSKGTILINPAFFPSVLIFFMLGVLSYKIYSKIKKIKISNNVGIFFLITISLYTIFYHFIQRDTHMLYILSIFLSTPILFIKFSGRILDRFLGELSYPIYISHALVKSLFLLLFPQINRNISNILILVLVIVFALFLHLIIEIPINKFRQNRVKK